MLSCMNYREEIIKLTEQLPGRTRELHFTINGFMPWRKYCTRGEWKIRVAICPDPSFFSPQAGKEPSIVFRACNEFMWSFKTFDPKKIHEVDRLRLYAMTRKILLDAVASHIGSEA